MQIGTFVRLVVPNDMKPDAFARGRVDGKEIYEDANGIREWIYVRWFCGDGRPDAETRKHHRSELEPV